MYVVVWHQEFHNYIKHIGLSKFIAQRKANQMNYYHYDMGQAYVYKISVFKYKKFKNKITSNYFNNDWKYSK